MDSKDGVMGILAGPPQSYPSKATPPRNSRPYDQGFWFPLIRPYLPLIPGGGSFGGG